jgi:hypothetical protein
MRKIAFCLTGVQSVLQTRGGGRPADPLRALRREAQAGDSGTAASTLIEPAKVGNWTDCLLGPSQLARGTAGPRSWGNED